MRQAELIDPPTPLKPRVLDNIENPLIGDRDNPINRVVDDLEFVGKEQCRVC